MTNSKKAYCPECRKEIFNTRADANRALKNMQSRHKTRGSVYQCRACGGFHVTHLTYREGRRRYQTKNPECFQPLNLTTNTKTK